MVSLLESLSLHGAAVTAVVRRQWRQRPRGAQSSRGASRARRSSSGATVGVLLTLPPLVALLSRSVGCWLPRSGFASPRRSYACTCLRGLGHVACLACAKLGVAEYVVGTHERHGGGGGTTAKANSNSSVRGWCQTGCQKMRSGRHRVGRRAQRFQRHLDSQSPIATTHDLFEPFGRFRRGI